jgi:ankyrin repeat protein
MEVFSALRRNRYVLPLGVAFAVLVGCHSSPEHNLPEPPRAASVPEIAETPQSTALVTNPAAAARLERVRLSLEQGLDVNQADADGRTALMMAAFEGYTEVAELLLDYGAEVDSNDSAGRTALMYASSGPFPQTVELLVRNGADVNHADKAEGWTALMLAAAEGHQAVVVALARRGANIEMTDQDGDAAIDHARERKQPEIVTLLQELKGDN